MCYCSEQNLLYAEVIKVEEPTRGIDVLRSGAMMALEGIRIIELSVLQQGPSAGAYLADMGAEVIKVEEPTRGDPARGIMSTMGVVTEGVGTHGLNFYFETHNRNKKGIALNLKREQGRSALYRLVAQSDVFLTNFRSAALEQLGLQYEILARHNPTLVYASASSYGHRGPDRDRPGVDPIMQARGGLMSFVTPSGYPPIHAGRSVSDQVGGLLLAFGIVTALLVRQRTGIGQEVRSSLLRAVLTMQSHYFQSFLFSGQQPMLPPRELAKDAFFNSYRGSDGKWFVIADMRSAEIWPQTCRALGLEQFVNDPRFCSYELRLANHQEVVGLLDRLFSTAPAASWVRRLQAVDIWVDMVATYAEVASDAQVIENQYVVEFDHPRAGRVRMQGVPVELSKTPGMLRSAAPTHSQHTEEVLIDLCGYTWDDIASLKEQGVIP